jgi:hypothetical protein
MASSFPPCDVTVWPIPLPVFTLEPRYLGNGARYEVGMHGGPI